MWDADVPSSVLTAMPDVHASFSFLECLEESVMVFALATMLPFYQGFSTLLSSVGKLSLAVLRANLTFMSLHKMSPPLRSLFHLAFQNCPLCQLIASPRIVLFSKSTILTECALSLAVLARYEQGLRRPIWLLTALWS